MQQCSHGVRFPVVGSVVADGRTIDVFCLGNYAQAKQRLFQYAQSIPVNGTVRQEGMITNGERSNHVVAGRGTRTAITGRRSRHVAPALGGDTVDAGNGVADFGVAGFGDVGVMA
jgi:hypothetical protein